MSSLKENLREWWKVPPSGVAVLALVVSVTNLWFATIRPAGLKVFLTKSAYLRFDPDRIKHLDFVAPVFLQNPGATGSIMIVQDAVADLRFTFDDGSKREIPLPWTEIRKLVRREKNIAADAVAGVEDDLITESRRVPMAIEGRKTELRYLRFEGDADAPLPPGSIKLEFNLRVRDVRGKDYPCATFYFQISEEQRKDSLGRNIYIWPTPL